MLYWRSIGSQITCSMGSARMISTKKVWRHMWLLLPFPTVQALSIVHRRCDSELSINFKTGTNCIVSLIGSLAIMSPSYVLFGF